MVQAPFVLFATQRTGSTWVIDTLNSHPHIRAHSELFLENGTGTPVWGGSRSLEFFETWRSNRAADHASGEKETIYRYLDRVFELRNSELAAGFKLMYGQAGAYPRIFDFCREHRVRVIHLIRANYLDLLISREVAVQRNLFHSLDRSGSEGARVRLDPDELPSKIAEISEEVSRARTLLRRSALDSCEVTYESLRDSNDFSRIVDFLEVDPAQPLASRLKRSIRGRHSEVIENFSAVRMALTGTPFAGFLDTREPKD